MDYIRKRIEKRMEELNIGQLEIAKRAKVSQSTINRVLNTPTKSRIDTLYKIAKALNIPLEYLVIKNEIKALLSRTIGDMNDQELQDTILHIEKERAWKKIKSKK
ncbi:MAG: helix-turn-helix transcriptional regulator [Syntrophaceae bacterium]|nr:helix-turn-helix transcriptional regulator [Syntrophaceae bacterium]